MANYFDRWCIWKKKAKMIWSQLLKYEYFLVSFLLCDNELNISGLWTKQYIWKWFIIIIIFSFLCIFMLWWRLFEVKMHWFLHDYPICKKSWFLSLIPNSSNMDDLGWQLTLPTIPKCQWWDSKNNFSFKQDLLINTFIIIRESLSLYQTASLYHKLSLQISWTVHCFYFWFYSTIIPILEEHLIFFFLT